MQSKRDCLIAWWPWQHILFLLHVLIEDIPLSSISRPWCSFSSSLTPWPSLLWTGGTYIPRTPLSRLPCHVDVLPYSIFNRFCFLLFSAWIRPYVSIYSRRLWSVVLGFPPPQMVMSLFQRFHESTLHRTMGNRQSETNSLSVWAWFWSREE